MTAPVVLVACAIALLVWPSPVRGVNAGVGMLGRTAFWSLGAWHLPRISGRAIAGGAAICAAVIATFAPWHAALCAGLLAAVAGWSWARGRARRAAADELARDVETLRAVAAELRAGHDLATALRSAAGMARTPMCTALARAAHAIQMGGDPAAALERTGAIGVDRLAGLVRLSGIRGIALADAVEVLAADAAERSSAERDVASLLAGPRATAGLLTLLPVFGIIMGQTIGADPWRILLHTTVGAAVMVAGALLAAAGVLWTDAMVTGAAR